MNILPKPKKLHQTSDVCTMDSITWIPDDSLPHEGYRIKLKHGDVEVRFADDHGKRYAQVTLEELRKHSVVNCGVIEDYPTYHHRGVHLDVARYFLRVEEIQGFIDIIGKLKFNVLHLHLSDEQGWRIEIPKYPLLTSIGSVRSHSDFGRSYEEGPYGGFYTREDLVSLVAYAQERAIDILPEIEMPGHCSPILAAYPDLSCHGEDVSVKTRGGVYEEVLCAGNEDVYHFLEDVVEECAHIFPYPYLHIGADEAMKKHWRTCPKCQKRMREEGLSTVAMLQDYFVNRMAAYCATLGKKAIIYSDGLRVHHACKDMDIQYWVGDIEQTKEMLKKGSKVIVSTHGKYYFDLGYGQTSLRSVYEYNPEEMFHPYESCVKGVEGMLWAEFTPTLNSRMIQAFPRLLALSETAWNGQDKEPYEEFVKRCRSFLHEHNIQAAPEKLWDMRKMKRIWDILRYYHRTMTRQDIRQFIATLRNEKKEKEENEKIIGN